MAEEERISITAVARDELSGPVATMRAGIRALGQEIRRLEESQKYQNATLSRYVAGVGNAATATRNFGGATGRLQSIPDPFSRLSQSARSYVSSLTNASAATDRFIGSALTRMTQSFAVASAGAAAFGLSAASSLEQVQVAFGTMFGKDQGAQLFANLRRINVDTPLTLQQLAGAAKTMGAYGMPQNQLVGMTKALADVGATVDPSKLNDLAIVIGQVQGQGRIYAQDLNQFVTAGIAAPAEVARELGISQEELQNRRQKGTLNAPAAPFLQAFQNLEGPTFARFRGAAKAQSRTMWGTMGNIKDFLISGDPNNDANPGGLVAGLAPFRDTFVQLGNAWLPQLARMAGQVGKSLGVVLSDLLRLGMELGPTFSGLLSGGLMGVHRLLMAMRPAITDLVAQTPELTRSFGGFLHQLEPLLPALGDLLRQTGPLTVSLLTLGTQLATVIVPPLVSFLEWLTRLEARSGAVRDATVVMLGSFLLLRQLTGVISIVKDLAFAWTLVSAAQTRAAGSAAAAAGAEAAAVGGGAAGAVGRGGAVATLLRTAKVVAGPALLLDAYKNDTSKTDPKPALGLAENVAGGALTGALVASVIPIPGVSQLVGGLVGGSAGFAKWAMEDKGDPSGSLARTAAFHGAVEAGTPGSRTITSSLRNFGVVGPDSGHMNGTALDMTGPFLRTYAQNLRAAGGWAQIHDAGNGAHLHGSYGDARPLGSAMAGNGGASSPMAVNVNFYGPVGADVDIERAVRRGIDSYSREKAERY